METKEVTKMKKQEAANMIINEIRALPDGRWGKYQPQETLVSIIDKVMGYDEYHLMSGRKMTKEPEKVHEIIRRMTERKIIIWAKNSAMFKLAI